MSLFPKSNNIYICLCISPKPSQFSIAFWEASSLTRLVSFSIPFKFFKQLAFTSKICNKVSGFMGVSDFIPLQERLSERSLGQSSMPFMRGMLLRLMLDLGSGGCVVMWLCLQWRGFGRWILGWLGFYRSRSCLCLELFWINYRPALLL